MWTLQKNRTGDIMNRVSEDVSKVRMFIGPKFYTLQFNYKHLFDNSSNV